MHTPSRLLHRLRSERAQTLLEYGLLVTMIAVVVVAAGLIFGVNVTGLFQSTAGHV